MSVMRIKLGNLKKVILESVRDAEIDAIVRQAQEINGKLNAMTTHDPSVSNPLRKQRYALVQQLRPMYYEALKAGDKERAQEITDIASMEVMDRPEPTTDVWLTSRQVYGGDPKKRPWGLGT